MAGGPPVLAVTGSTGAVGGMVARDLAAVGVAQRLLVRDATRAPQLRHTDVRQVSYAQGAAARDALDGVDTLLMISASESADRLDQHRVFVDAAAAAGVRQVVYTSFAGAAPDAIFTLGRDHWATEEHIRATGMAWTFLRDSFYLDFLELMIGEDGVIRGPAGGGRCAFVARADVARVATTVLLDPLAHAGASYDLTGPQALTLAEVADQVGAARRADIRFHDETPEEAYRSRAVYGAPAWQVEAWVSTYTAIASGTLAEVSGAVEQVSGAPPLSLAAYLAAYPAPKRMG